jgi:MFS family permease
MATSVRSEESQAGYAGWRVVLAAHCGVMMSFGSLLVFTFSVFLKPLTAEFGWGREEVSRAFGIAAMTVAASSPWLGRLLDRGEPRRVVLPCLAVFGLAFGSLGLLTPHLAHLYFVFFVIGLVGNGTTQMGFSGAVSSWFTERRGLALALVMAGAGLGSIVLPPLAQGLMGAYGWRTAYFVLGGLSLAVSLPLAARYLRTNPWAKRRHAATRGGAGAALRTRAFWILVAALFLSSIAANGAIAHLAALLTDRGLEAGTAAWIAAALGGASLGGRLLTGHLLDRFWGPLISCLLLVAMAAGILLLAYAHTFAAGFAAALLIGLGLGGEADVTPYLLARYFGLSSFSTLYGVTWTFYAIAGGVGPVLLGRVFDATASYTLVLTLLTIPTAVSAMLMLWMPAYEQ